MRYSLLLRAASVLHIKKNKEEKENNWKTKGKQTEKGKQRGAFEVLLSLASFVRSVYYIKRRIRKKRKTTGKKGKTN